MTRRRLPYLIFGALALLILGLPAPHPKRIPSGRHIKIEASRFAFTPGTIRVNPGDRVILELTASDVVHGLYLDNYDISITADPGQSVRMEFTADQVGSFRFRCSVACGDMHPFMIGKLLVGVNWMLWRGILLFTLIPAAVIWGAGSRRNGFNANLLA